MPLAEAVALSYSPPLFVTIGAVLFLGGIVRMRRWSAVVAGFIGASLYIAHREHGLARQRRRQVPAASAEPPI